MSDFTAAFLQSVDPSKKYHWIIINRNTIKCINVARKENTRTQQPIAFNKKPNPLKNFGSLSERYVEIPVRAKISADVKPYRKPIINGIVDTVALLVIAVGLKHP